MSTIANLPSFQVINCLEQNFLEITKDQFNDFENINTLKLDIMT